MIFLMVGLVLVLVVLIIRAIMLVVNSNKENKHKKLKEQYRTEAREGNTGYYTMNWETWLVQKGYHEIEYKHRWEVEAWGSEFIVCGVCCIVCGLIIVSCMNLVNVDNQAGAVEKSIAYQSFVDNTESITNDGYAQVNEWNNMILVSRHNQHHPLWGSHYILCDDWNNVPLVVYTREGDTVCK